MNEYSRRVSPFVSAMLAFAGAILLTACNQSNSGASIPAHGSPTAFSEPGLTAKLVDAESKKPVEGAVIYGYYASQSGTLGGGKQLGEQVKSFEAQSDENGVFTLPAWTTGERKLSGQAMSTFPVVVIYKPGYDMEYQTLSSITRWRPKTGVADTTYELKDNVYDWTKFPYLLTPLNNEKDRYAALNDSSFGMMFIGECGWEPYPKTLLVRHNENLRIMSALIPEENRDAEGYLKSGRPGPDVAFANFFQRSVVHQLFKAFNQSNRSWTCANPHTVFRAKKWKNWQLCV